MERILSTLRNRLASTTTSSASYQPLEASIDSLLPQDPNNPSSHNSSKRKISWLRYSIFVVLGIAMLWAWNMFLAAAPYFQMRFSTSEWLTTHFQPGIVSVSNVATLGSMLLLTKMQRNASYPKRIIASLGMNMAVFTLLALSTVFFRGVKPETYFGFLMVMVFVSSLATGLCQNGLFAFVAGYGTSEYTQAIMTGQGIAGILPPLVQIITVLSVPKKKAQGGDTTHESPESAFIYFLTALGVSTFALFSFLYLLRRDAHRHQAKSTVDAMDSEDSPLHAERKTVGLWALFKKLPYLSLAVFIVFSITMVYPVFTQEILSNTPTDTAPRILKPASFIPLGFLLWDLGDLLGRMAPLVPVLSGGVRHPKLIFIASALRIVFVPLYLLCNIRGRGAVVPSDAFYLIVVQLLFGLTNGYLGSSCMMGAPEWVEPEEREAAGSFMGLMLVSGLTAGGLLSFAVARL